jgi:ribulose-bisphosphate carboxylase small chain
MIHPCNPYLIHSLLLLLISYQVLREIDQASQKFPNSFVRMSAFDSVRQVQVASMLVHRPSSSREWKPVNQRQV